MIIQIIGTPGSGKSYIGHSLAYQPNIVVIDTDDLMIEAFDELIKKRSFRKDLLDDDWRQFESLVIKKRDAIVKKNKKERKNPVFVYTGITVEPHDTPDHIFLIKIIDLKIQYRKFLQRELAKINKNYQTISNIIDNDEDVYLIHEIINNKFQLVEKFPISYDEYAEIYELYVDKYEEIATKYADVNKIINLVREISLIECGLH